MSIEIITKNAKIVWLTPKSNNGLLTKDHGILYVTNWKAGQVGISKDITGFTPANAVVNRYNTTKSPLEHDLNITGIIVFDKTNFVGKHYNDPDNNLRMDIKILHKHNKIPFDANVKSNQKKNSNHEALLDFNFVRDFNTLVDIFKQSVGISISSYYDIRSPIGWWYKQADDAEEIYHIIKLYARCLYAGYTARGKTKIGINAAVKLLVDGGLVLVTTPIVDTKESFKTNLAENFFGANRTLKITYMDAKEFIKLSSAALKARISNRELIFLVISVQDVRYSDKDNTDQNIIRKKYNVLHGNIDLWIRDERHLQYEGYVTAKKFKGLTARYELDLTATPYNVLTQYDRNEIVARSLLWGLKHAEHTHIPAIQIDAIETPFANISAKMQKYFVKKEGFHPGKLFLRKNGNFVLESELIELADLFYHTQVSKNKNTLSISNDDELSSVAKQCGLWVLPKGVNGDGAGQYIPALAKLLTLAAKGKTLFIDAYDLTTQSRKHQLTVGEMVEKLLCENKRVIILTCGKFRTGTDIKPLGHIVLLDKVSSISNFEQLLGRMIRIYPGKDSVKMYAMTPATELKLLMGKIAKANSHLSGGGKTEEIKMLDCVPLTEYTANSRTRIAATDILNIVHEYFKNISKTSVPGYALEDEIRKCDNSLYDNFNVSSFNSTVPKTQVTDETGALVSEKKSSGTTGKGSTPANKVRHIAKLIQDVMQEAQWIAVTQSDYNLKSLLNNSILISMYGNEILEAVRDTCVQNKQVRKLLNAYLLDRKNAFDNLIPSEHYEEIYKNTTRKKKLGIVYVDFKTARLLVDKKEEIVYNTILIENALNGVLPLCAREKYPNAEIVCYEHFSYFKGHLESLGFKVITKKERDSMDFALELSNYPYNEARENNDDNTNNSTLYKDLLLAPKPIVFLRKTIAPASPTKDVTFMNQLRNVGLKEVIFLPPETFSNVSIRGGVCVYIFERGYDGNIFVTTSKENGNTEERYSQDRNLPISNVSKINAAILYKLSKFENITSVLVAGGEISTPKGCGGSIYKVFEKFGDIYSPKRTPEKPNKVLMYGGGKSLPETYAFVSDNYLKQKNDKASHIKKVIVSRATNKRWLGVPRLINEGVAVSGSVSYIPAATSAIGNEIKEWLEDDVILFIISFSKFSDVTNTGPLTWNHIPHYRYATEIKNMLTDEDKLQITNHVRDNVK